MQIFVSWSGKRSKAVANALKLWLNDVFQNVDVWMSAHDIDAGARWNATLDSILETANIGIICITPENQNTPWLLYEAGAIAKAAKIARVIPYRVGLSAIDVQYPIAQFQGVDANKAGTLKLLESINEACGLSIPQERVGRIFERWWPDLEAQLHRLPAPERPAVPKRSDRELLEEILELLRNSLRPVQSHLSGPETAKTETSDGTADVHEEYVLLDTTPFLGEKGFVKKLIIKSSDPVSEFLNKIYRIIDEVEYIPIFAYGKTWVIEDEITGKRYDDIGIEYCKTQGGRDDSGSLGEAQICNGARLRVVRIEKPVAAWETPGK